MMTPPLDLDEQSDLAMAIFAARAAKCGTRRRHAAD
jgi:hypothetical protein